MGAIVVYMTKRYIVHEDANRLEQDSFKNRLKNSHVSPWLSVNAYQFTRANPAQLLMEFFIFKKRFMNFERYQTWLDRAISKIGRSQFIFSKMAFFCLTLKFDTHTCPNFYVTESEQFLNRCLSNESVTHKKTPS